MGSIIIWTHNLQYNGEREESLWMYLNTCANSSQSNLKDSILKIFLFIFLNFYHHHQLQSVPCSLNRCMWTGKPPSSWEMIEFFFQVIAMNGDELKYSHLTGPEEDKIWKQCLTFTAVSSVFSIHYAKKRFYHLVFSSHVVCKWQSDQIWIWFLPCLSD